MKFRPRFELFVGTFSLLATFAILQGVSLVPFHPDETSILYQTQDLERWLTMPGSMSWDADREGETDQIYRLLNPPLPKYILGVARRMAGYGPEQASVDWNWSETWEENLAVGAFPNQDLLLAGRYASTILALLALIPLSLSAKRMGGKLLVVFVVILYLSNALVLIHGRRLMSEGTLLFGISLAIYMILEADRTPGIAGAACALAVCSKLSALPLLFVGFLASGWAQVQKPILDRLALRRVVLFLLVAIAVIYLLNPILWENPIGAIQNIWAARRDFTERQVETLDYFAPEYILKTPVDRMAGMIFHLFLAPPQTYEAGNYVEEIQAEIDRYTSNPFHSIGRGWTAGALAIGLAITGVIGSALDFQGKTRQQRRALLLVFIATGIEMGALLWANPVPFQRYYIPLVPFIILWTSLGAKKVYSIIKKAAEKSAARF